MTDPVRCEVLVVGAGPAGSACAQVLAAAGVDVLLVDQHDFPRDKVCGDGLIPDSLAALQRLGVAEEVAALAMPVRHVRLVGPRGGQVDVPGRLAVLPRLQLDDVLLRAALRSGARLQTRWRFEGPELEGGGTEPMGAKILGAKILGEQLRGAQARVVGARFKDLDQPAHSRSVQARWVVLATGAVPAALTAAGLCERHTPSGVALRAYVQAESLRDRIQQLHIVWHPRLQGGYGWIFPLPGGLFNIGAGLTGSHRRNKDGKGQMQPANLHRMLEAFAEIYPLAGELMKNGSLQGEIKGAPLRCSLQGARLSRPGLLATGEALGSTYAFSGEGIGKALETGMLAAQVLCAAFAAAGTTATPAMTDAAVQADYAARVSALQPMFDLYERASWVNQHPWMADLVIWRARRSPSILRRLSGVLEETQNPGRLFTLRGIRKLMFE